MSADSPLRRYWRNYGGYSAIFRSPFFWLAVISTSATYPYWATNSWWDLPIKILPSLLGFSLGGFALIIGFGSERFLNLISGTSPDELKPSPYIETVASFLHFILVQAVGLILATTAQIFSSLGCYKWFDGVNFIASKVFYTFGVFFFFYALFLVLATAISAYEVASWFDDLRTLDRDEEKARVGRTAGSKSKGEGQ